MKLSSVIQIFMPFSGGVTTAVVIPTVPGMEWTLGENHMHWTLDDEHMHWTLDTGCMHWTLDTE